MRIRTGYSFRTAVGHIDEVLDRMIDIGMDTAVITDRFSTFGYRRFRDACKKKNIRPVYGVELGVVESKGQRKPIINYWTFLAKSEIKSVNQLVSKATSGTDKTDSLLLGDAVNAEGVIKIIGERVTYDQMVAIRGAQDCFLALGPSTPKKAVIAARGNNIPLIAVSDNYYPRKEDFEFYRVALGRRASNQTYPTHILSDDEWREAVKYVATTEEIEQAIKNRNEALSCLNADLLNAEMYKPPRPKTLREMCIEGAARTGTDLTDPVYSARLDRELLLIKEKDFEDYFYIVSDIVSWAKERMIVGPGRGSSAGSLVCYLLNITAVDPVKNGLIFERFIDINRGGWSYIGKLKEYGPFPPPSEVDAD
jgi:DNA polymerase III alpha subunit